MLTSIRKEMQAESTFPMAAPKPLGRVEVVPSPGPIKHAFATTPAPREKVDALLAERDEQIAELQQAITELAGSRSDAGSDDTAWQQRLDALEARVAEQDAAVRHVLALLIDWFESDAPRAAA